MYKMQVPNLPILLSFLKAFSNMYVNLIGNLKKYYFLSENGAFSCIDLVWQAQQLGPTVMGPCRPFPSTLVALLPVALGELKSDDRTKKKHDSKSEAKKTRELFSKLLLRYSIYSITP